MKQKNITKLCFIFQINSPLLCEVFPLLKLTENFKKFSHVTNKHTTLLLTHLQYSFNKVSLKTKLTTQLGVQIGAEIPEMEKQ